MDYIVNVDVLTLYSYASEQGVKELSSLTTKGPSTFIFSTSWSLPDGDYLGVCWPLSRHRASALGSGRAGGAGAYSGF
jgi:hypothetical protein